MNVNFFVKDDSLLGFLLRLVFKQPSLCNFFFNLMVFGKGKIIFLGPFMHFIKALLELSFYPIYMSRSAQY